ncbi:MAG TPA: hypothetical protein VFG50_11955, partial [Rhodothermales bacterium]|nr:hypothetical protein [Rhodothermales bacterium]
DDPEAEAAEPEGAPAAESEVEGAEEGEPVAEENVAEESKPDVPGISATVDEIERIKRILKDLE